MLRAAKTKSPREVGILDMGQRILQPAARTYLHYLSKILKIFKDISKNSHSQAIKSTVSQYFSQCNNAKF